MKTLTKKQIIHLLNFNAIYLIVIFDHYAWAENVGTFKIVANLLDVLKANGVQVDENGNVDVTTIHKITFTIEE